MKRTWVRDRADKRAISLAGGACFGLSSWSRLAIDEVIQVMGRATIEAWR